MLDSEMQIIWGKRRILNATYYDISSQFALQTQNANVNIKSFLCTQDTSNHTIKLSKDKLLMDGKTAVVHGKNSAHAPKDYPKESTKWVKDTPMIQQGPKNYNENTFTSFAAKISNLEQAKMVFDHITGVHAVSFPIHTIYAYKICKANTVNNSLAQKSSTFTFIEDD